MSVSAIVISYRNPKYLDLCLKSLTEHKNLPDTEIIVVLDGYVNESEEIVNKYHGINVVAFEENKGQTYAHNYGVISATGDEIVLLNDDNIAPPFWDQGLSGRTNLIEKGKLISDKLVVAPNQIEPLPSIFSSFVIKNLGITPEEFRYDEYKMLSSQLSSEYGNRFQTSTYLSPDGGSWPLFIKKKHYMMLGGIDPYFPHPPVADHDFFLRCELAGLQCVRYHGVHFYHFAGASTRRTQQNWNEKEWQSHEYFFHKWGFHSTFRQNNSHAPKGETYKGVQF